MLHSRWLIVALAVTVSCGSSPTDPLPPGTKRVLFIGNSLTYSNDLPATVAAIATLAGDSYDVASVAWPGLALIDHAMGASNAMGAISQGPWDFVVLQQGPTTQSLCRDTLVLAAQLFDPVIRQAGARPALFMTWPSSGQTAAFEAVRLSFQTAAQAVGGIFLPAGDAWRRALASDPSVDLYAGDGFHPDVAGSFLAALEIYERLSGRDVRTLPPKAFLMGMPYPLPVATVRLLQSAAHEANVAYPDEPVPPASRTGERPPGLITC